MLIGWIVLPAAVFLYLRFGYVPVAVNDPADSVRATAGRGGDQEAKIGREAPAGDATTSQEESCRQCEDLSQEAGASNAYGLPGTPLSGRVEENVSRSAAGYLSAR